MALKKGWKNTKIKVGEKRSLLEVILSFLKNAVPAFVEVQKNVNYKLANLLLNPDLKKKANNIYKIKSLADIPIEHLCIEIPVIKQQFLPPVCVCLYYFEMFQGNWSVKGRR